MKYDLPQTTQFRTDAARYQVLITKNDRTTVENTELATLTSSLTEYMITASDWNTMSTDVSSLLTNILLKAPSASPAFTGTPTAPTPTATVNTTQIANMNVLHTVANNRYATTSGTANAYTVVFSPAPTSYSDGLCITVKIHAANTGNCTINVNSMGARAIRRANGAELKVGALVTGAIYTLRYNTTTGNFQLQGEGGDQSEPSFSGYYPIASGSTLNPNDLVEFTTDGKAKKTVATFISGSPQGTNLGTMLNSANYSRVYRISDDRGILAYAQSSSVFNVLYFEIIGANVYTSTPIAITTTTTAQYPAIEFINQTQFVVVYRDGGTSQGIKGSLFNYSNGSISFVTTALLASYSTSISTRDFRILSLDTNKFVIGFEYGTSTPVYTNRAFTCIKNSDNTFTSTATTNLGSGYASGFEGLRLFKIDASNFVATFIAITGSTLFVYKYSIGVDNLITLTSAGGNLGSIASGARGMDAMILDSNRFLLTTSGSLSSVVGTHAYVINYNTNTIESTTTMYNSSSISDTYLELIDPINPNRFLVVSRLSYTLLVGTVIDVSGTTVSVVSQNSAPFIANTNSMSDVVRIAAGKFIVPQAITGNIGYLTFYSVVNGAFGGGMTDVQDAQGIVVAVGTDTVKVALNNSIVGGFTGLIPTTLFYCDEYGNLTSNVKEGYKVGVAISATEVFFYGLRSLKNFRIPYLDQEFRTHSVTGTATTGRIVKLNSNGTISNYDGSGFIYGIYQGSNKVLLSGISKVHSGLKFDSQYYFDNTGLIGLVDMGTNRLAGVPISTTELYTDGFIMSHNN